jgi:ribosomal protein L40E
MMEKETRRFEVETCGRCGGSGEYSYNPIDGTTCYGCRGKRKRYTKRGQAAFDYYRKLCTKKATDVVVGDCVEAFGKVHKVEGIEYDVQEGESYVNGVMTPYRLDRVVFIVNGGCTSAVFSTSDVLTWPNGDEKRDKLTAAYDYQYTLTAAGKPRKKKESALVG